MGTAPVRTVRTVAGGAALILGCLLAAAAIVAGLANRELLDSGRFARHVEAIRTDSAVADQVGKAITARVLQIDPDLVALKPVIQTTATTLTQSTLFTPLVAAAARQLHAAFTKPHSGQVVLRLADVGALVVPTLRTLAPDLAKSLPPDFDVTLARIGAQDFAGQSVAIARRIRLLSWLLPLLAGVCFVAAFAVSPDRRRMVGRIGIAICVAGVLVGVAAIIGSAVVANMPSDTLHGAMLHAAWRQLIGPIRGAVLAVVIAGALLTAAAGMRVESGHVATMRRVLRRWMRGLLLRSQETRTGRMTRAVVIGALGAVLLIWPLPLVRVVAVVTGLALVVVGAVHLAAEAPAPQVRPESSRRGARVLSWLAAASVAVVVLGALVASGVRPSLGHDPPASAAVPGKPCDGYLALCNRRYNEVAFPATHNSMAAADEPGWLFAEQPDGIMAQLNAGIRVLLVDSVLGQPTQRPDIVLTPSGAYAEALAVSNQDLGKETVASALRVRNLLRLNPTGPPRPYLCHGLCELGATPWEPVMAQVDKWLVAHPREILTFFIQDDDVTPEQTDAVFREAGLLRYVYTQQPGRPWPTLAQMIKSDRRVVVLMENRDGGTRYPWQMRGFTWTQDTPYHFTSADQFNCARLRGDETSPLLLVNHWLSNPLRRITESATANSYDILWSRMSQCRAERGQIPNFVAVNFYNEGDLFRVVDQLNGVP
jgi:hypothetical protein